MSTPPVRRGRVLRHLNPATVMSATALFVALGGTSYAAITLPAKSVGPRELRSGAVSAPKLRTGAVTSAKVRDGSLRARDFRAGELPEPDRGATGSQGPAGPAGATGPRGADGPAGPSGRAGDPGPAGPRGEAGPAGEPGAPGPRGEAGATGARGPVGPSASAGRSVVSGTTTQPGEVTTVVTEVLDVPDGAAAMTIAANVLVATNQGAARSECRVAVDGQPLGSEVVVTHEDLEVAQLSTDRRVAVAPGEHAVAVRCSSNRASNFGRGEIVLTATG
ncbi:collagen-like protein [Patulibacter americanus]|uniref:collagen-like protein n=1 Tax=Patulibacter americanus TaxID=588672 RepID=UPI0003B4502E|nr:collagen-like protein [Patulibacter americanus]